MKRIQFLCGVAAIALLSAAAPAAAAGLINGSFEQPATVTTIALHAANPAQASFITGWTVVDTTADGDDDVQYFNNSAFGAVGVVGTDGAYLLDLTGDTGRGKGVASDLIGVSSGTAYRVGFDVGAFFVAGYGSFGDATVDLLVNDVLAGSFTNTMSLSSAGSDWQRFTYDFVASGPTAKLTFLSSTALTSSNLGVGLDNVTFDTVGGGVPEPATWAMMILGFGMAGAAARARRKHLV